MFFKINCENNKGIGKRGFYGFNPILIVKVLVSKEIDNNKDNY